MPERKSRAPKSGAGPTRRARTPRARAGTDASITTDLFFRHMVNSMRNGVLAIARDGRLVFANDVACRTLGVSVESSGLGRPFFEVLENSPDIVRILAGAFELSHLPNRAELRLKPSGKVIGYTLSHVRDERGRAVGAALFFKDLTRVEQIEERERLRDRLAALGEMAAAIAHEVKNPLAGIEVMAGLLKRQLPDSGDAHALLGDIIKDAKMANAIVIEVLDFVRPIRLQVERVSLPEVFQNAVTMAESKAARGRAEVAVTLDPDVPDIQGDEFQLRQLFTNLFTNAFEALGGKGHVSGPRAAHPARGRRRARDRRARVGGGDRGRVGRRTGPAGRAGGSDLQPLLHDQAAGLGSGAGHRPEDRGRARRAHRRDDPRERRNGVSRDAPARRRASAVPVGRARQPGRKVGERWDAYWWPTITTRCGGASRGR